MYIDHRELQGATVLDLCGRFDQTDNDRFIQTIETSFIEINLNDNTVTSDQPVVITGPDYIIRSNGFIANLLTRKFELFDHVQTVFQPKPAG